MYSIGCTLGAAMTTCEAPTSPFASSGPSTKSYVHSVVSKYESQTYECSESRRVSTVPQTPRVLGSAGSSLSSASSGPPLEMTQGFYCKSAPAYVCEFYTTHTHTYTCIKHTNRITHIHNTHTHITL